jgi:hypothetical protein
MAKNTISDLTISDLQDPTLFRLNSVLRFLAQQVTAVQTGSGPYRFVDRITAPAMFLDTDAIPTDPLAVLTKGAADKLYSPEALGAALSTGRFEGQPIGGGGVGGGSGTGGGSGSTTQVQVSYGVFYANSIQRQLNQKLGDQVSVLDFGAVGDDTTDSTMAFQNALDAVQAAGRSTEILVPAGTYRLRQVKINPNTPPVRFVGQGEGSVLKFWTRYNTASETWDVPAGEGRIFIQSSNVAFKDLVLDGNQTVPVQFSYDAIPNRDMLSNVVTDRSMIWVKPTSGNPVSGINLSGVIMRHVLGHGLILDTSSAAIRDVCVVNVRWEQTRSGLFGVTTVSAVVNRTGASVARVSGGVFVGGMAGQYVVIGSRAYRVQSVVDGNTLTLANDEAGNPPFGSETGVSFWWGSDMQYGGPMACVYYRGNGQAQGDPMLSNLVIVGNTFRRFNGECVKGDALGIEALHSGISISGNVFWEIGYGTACPGFSDGVTVSGNGGRRIGYVTTSDAAAAIPKYLANNNASVMRTYGLVRSFSVTCNSFLNFNGNGIWLSGASNGSCTGNALAIANPGTSLFNEDSVGGYGTVGNNLSTGIYVDNYFQEQGADRVVVAANSITNTGLGGILLRNARRCAIKTNSISLNSTALEIPIFITNFKGIVGGALQTYAQWQASSNHRSYDNDICDNVLYMENGVKVGIQEVTLNDPTTNNPFLWQSTDVNRIFDNRMLGTNRGEFIKAAQSGSYVGASWSSPDPAATGISRLDLIRDGFASTARTTWRVNESGTVSEIMRLLDAKPQLQIGADTAAKGMVLTGNRSGLQFNDLVGTGKVYLDGFLWVRADTYSAAEADSLDDTQGLIAWDAANKKLVASETTNSGARVWQNLLGQDTDPGGPDQAIQFNNSGSFAGSANLLFDSATRLVSLLGTMHIVADAANNADIVLIVRAAAGQTGNLQEWRDGNGNSLVAIAPNGGLYFRTAALVPAGGVGVIGYNTATGKMQVSNNGGAFEDIVIGPVIKSINGLTNSAISIVQGDGIIVSNSPPGTISIANNGVLSFNGSVGPISLASAGLPNGIVISPVGPSSFVISLPQPLGTTAGPQFDTLLLVNQSQSIQAFGSIVILPFDPNVGYFMGGTKVIDNAGRFVGSAILTPGQAQAGSFVAPQYFSSASGTPIPGRTGNIVISGTTITCSGGLII